MGSLPESEQPEARGDNPRRYAAGKVAVFLVSTVGVIEVVVGGLTADSGLELLLVAWAASVGGVWFLFDKADAIASSEVQEQAAHWLASSRREDFFNAAPERFAAVFDAVFGRRLISARRIVSSTIASVVALSVVTLLWASVNLPRVHIRHALGTDTVLTVRESLDLQVLLSGAGVVLPLALLLNLVPDYLSLIQTRWAIGWAARTRTISRPLLVDFVFTCMLAGGAVATGACLLLAPVSARDETTLGTRAYQVASDLILLSPTLDGLEVRAIPIRVDSVEAEEPDVGTAEATLLLEARSSVWCRSLEDVAQQSELCRNDAPPGYQIDWRRGPEYRTHMENLDTSALGRTYSAMSEEGWELRGDRWMDSLGEQERSLVAAYHSERRSAPHDVWIATGFPTLELSPSIGFTQTPGPSAALPFGLYFYSAFFTSLWLWLYVTAALIARVLIRADSRLRALLRLTDWEAHPLKVIGAVSTVLLSLMFAAAIPFVT